MLLAKGTVLGKRWEIEELVGEGACGRVYAVKSSTGATFGFPLVAKVIPTSVGTGKAAIEQKRLCDTLNYENTLFIGNLCEFSFRPCIPDIRTFHGVDTVHGVRYLVMERFERDLVGFASHCKPTNQSVANIGLQLLEGLLWMHKKGLLFIDVKPDNFMLNGDKIKFVDYGLVERWVSAMGTGSKVQQVRTMAGTPSFASLDVHNGSTPMRKDDLESMGLVLISLFLGGTLPWSDSKSDNECKKRKIDCDIKTLSKINDCPEVGEIILLCRSLVYDEKPDYDLYKSILEKMRDRKTTTAPTPTPTISIIGSPKRLIKSHLMKMMVAVEAIKISDRITARVKEAEMKKTLQIKKTVEVKEMKEKKISAVSKKRKASELENIEIAEYNTAVQKIVDIKRSSSSSSCNSSNSSPVRRSARIELLSPSSNKKKNENENISESGPSSVNLSKKFKKSFAANSPKKVEQKLFFEYLSGPNAGISQQIGSSYTVGREQKIFGRDGGPNDIKLGADQMISEKHFCALWSWDKEGKLELNIQDKKSTNGTKLETPKGKITRLTGGTWYRAHDSDVIKVGGIELKISCTSAI